jgi:hypothetical protein
MIKIANVINSFALEQAEVQPSEEPIFVLTSTQFHDLVSEAIQPLMDEVQDLKDIITRQDEKIAALEATEDVLAENDLNQLRLINDLRKVQEPQPLQRDRGEILHALLVAHGGKMLATDARKRMRLNRSRFSELLGTMKDDIEVRPYHLNKSWNVLVLK